MPSLQIAHPLSEQPTRPLSRPRRLLRSVGYAVAFTLPVAAIGYLVRSRWEPILHLDESVIRTATSFTRERPGLFRALVVWEALGIRAAFHEYSRSDVHKKRVAKNRKVGYDRLL